MILFCSLVKFPVIDTHPPSGYGLLRNQFILSICNNRQSSLLWHNLDWANLLAVWYRIDNPGMQEFQDLFLYNLSHCIIESSLRFPRGSTLGVNKNTMGAKRGINLPE